jgi:hypothetical protein
MPNLSTLLWQHDSNQPASDKHGAVHCPRSDWQSQGTDLAEIDNPNTVDQALADQALAEKTRMSNKGLTVPEPLVRVSCQFRMTLYIWPLEQPGVTHSDPADSKVPGLPF